MQGKKTRRLALLALPLSLALVAGACGGDDDDDATGDEGDGTEEDFSGQSVSVTGSSTVEPISAIVAEEFDGATGANTTVDGPGTGDGFEEFCKGNADITDASRTIKDEEAAACEAAGIDYVELKVGFDGMAVLTSPNNDAVECLNFADLYALIGPEAQDKVSKWSDASALAGELGSTTELPDETLELTGPGPESGTYDSFIEIAFKSIAEERGQDPKVARDDYSQSSEDNTILANVEASDTSLGWVGFSFAEQEGDSVKILEVSDGEGECTAPTAETIADGSYPLSRPLYIYVNKAKAEENPAVAGYVDYYLSDLNTWVEEALYVALPDEDVEATKATWEGR